MRKYNRPTLDNRHLRMYTECVLTHMNVRSIKRKFYDTSIRPYSGTANCCAT